MFLVCFLKLQGSESGQDWVKGGWAKRSNGAKLNELLNYTSILARNCPRRTMPNSSQGASRLRMEYAKCYRLDVN
jgi:hypothetical protein